MEAYLQHGKWGGPYVSESVEVKETAELPRKGQTQMGYGNALPTNYMVRWNKRWFRVVVVCWSNSGTAYIKTKAEGNIVVRIDS